MKKSTSKALNNVEKIEEKKKLDDVSNTQKNEVIYVTKEELDRATGEMLMIFKNILAENIKVVQETQSKESCNNPACGYYPHARNCVHNIPYSRNMVNEF
jgi:hypothetical protein